MHYALLCQRMAYLEAFKNLLYIALYHTSPEKQTLLKTLWEKEKMLVTSIFSFSHNVFYPFPKRISVFKSNPFCRLQMLSIWTSLKICRLVRGYSCDIFTAMQVGVSLSFKVKKRAWFHKRGRMIGPLNVVPEQYSTNVSFRTLFQNSFTYVY